MLNGQYTMELTLQQLNSSLVFQNLYDSSNKELLLLTKLLDTICLQQLQVEVLLLDLEKEAFID